MRHGPLRKKNMSRITACEIKQMRPKMQTTRNGTAKEMKMYWKRHVQRTVRRLPMDKCRYEPEDLWDGKEIKLKSALHV